MNAQATEIILARHGQTEWNRIERFRGQLDIALNATGVKQAEALGERIARRFHPAAIYSSPLNRAIKTAEPLARLTGLSVQILDGLLDINFGDWQGLTPEEVEAKYPEEYRQWLEEPQKVHIPGGETLEQARARAVAALETVADQHQGQTIVLVSHKVICKVLMCAVLGLDNSHYWAIEQDNAMMDLFDRLDKDGYLIKLVNETCHLEGLTA